jgi:hypothetical protein
VESSRNCGQKNIRKVVLPWRRGICSQGNRRFKSAFVFRRVPSLKRFALLSVVLLPLCLSGCFSNSSKFDGSILIIAVQGLRADDIPCGATSDSLTPQMDSICNEGVRFTHAYTPSVLSSPALSSVLTGLYPSEHQVHRNGPSLFPDGVKSVVQGTADKGYGTIFVSGGPPFLRKVAVSKGFEDFDDSLRVDGGFFRPARVVARKYINLFDSRGDRPFFDVVEFADLSFPETVSATTPENTEGSYNGKLVEIDEAIGEIKKDFKQRKAWDSLTVVIVGLQGSSKGEHEGLARGINLYDEVVRVPLIIKPARKPRDLAPSWKIDGPVTLVDLGLTLFKLAGVSGNQSQYPVIDLSGALQGKDLPEGERPLFCESDLPQWRNWGPRLVSVRMGEWVYMTPPDPKLFNTYTDHLELRNLFSVEYNAFVPLDKVWRQFGHDLRGANASPSFLPYSVSEKLRITRILFSKSSQPDEKIRAIRELEMRRPGDWQVYQWHVSLLLERQDWLTLNQLLSSLRALDKEQNKELKIWRTFAALRSRGKVNEQDLRNDPMLSCLYVAVGLKRFSTKELEALQSQQVCQDPETQYWLSTLVNTRLKKSRESSSFYDLAKAATDKHNEQTELAKSFWIDGATWDYTDSLPSGPSMFELFNALANSAELQNLIRKKPTL